MSSLNSRPGKSAALLATACITSVVSANVAAEDWTIESGSFFMAGVSASPTAFTTITPSTDFENSYLGAGGAGRSSGSPDPETIVGFAFFNSPVNTYTAASNLGDSNSAAGSIPGGPVPDIDIENLTADVSAFFANWNGTDFNQGSANATVIDNGDGSFQVRWNSLIVGGPFDGFTGSWVLNMCLDCESSGDPVKNLSASQAAATTRTVITGSGNVTVSTNVADPADYTFNWAASDSALIDTAVGGTANPTFVFDPSGLAEGVYTVSVATADISVTPNLRATSTIQLRVVSTGDLALIGDDDNDGVPNTHDDASLSLQQLQSTPGDATTGILESSAGTFAVGRTAFCAETNAAGLTSADIRAYAGSGCSTVTNAVDRAAQTEIGGLFDFEVRSLTPGQEVQIVIPLSQAMPANAVYHKYFINGGWQPFDTRKGDSTASAPGAAGVCPAPDSAQYTSGLNAGDYCVRLTLADGGPNDADGAANGVILDPGGVAAVASGQDTELGSGGGCTIAPHTSAAREMTGDWVLLGAALLGLASFRRRA